MEETMDMAEGVVGCCNLIRCVCCEIRSGRFRFSGTPHFSRANPVDRLVLGHPHQPGWWVIKTDDLITLFPTLDQDILYHIFCLVGVIDDAQCQPVKAVTDGSYNTGVLVQNWVRLPKTRRLRVVCYRKDGKKCWGLRRAGM